MNRAPKNGLEWRRLNGNRRKSNLQLIKETSSLIIWRGCLSLRITEYYGLDTPRTLLNNLRNKYHKLLPQLLLERFRQRRDDREQITHHAISCELEDRSIGILVDGYDEFGVPHADQMLDRAGDATGDV